jgi:hypothetical protein
VTKAASALVRILSGLAGLVIFVVTFGGGISLFIVVGRSAWGWLFLVVPAVVVAAIFLIRVGIRLVSRGLDG